jgi:hypothetical protein
LRRAVTILAFLAGVLNLVVLTGGGLALVLIRNSGERGSGALFALCGLIAFASVMVLVTAGEERFQERNWRAGAIAAAILGAMPIAGLSAAAFRFAGFPIRSPIPLVDWSVFLAGAALAAGAVAILVLGYWRARTVGAAEPDEVIHMHQIREAQTQLRTALERASLATQRYEDEEEVRVRRV